MNKALLKEAKPTHSGGSCETCTSFMPTKKYGMRTAFRLIYEEIRDALAEDAVFTVKELTGFIKDLEARIFEEYENDDN